MSTLHQLAFARGAPALAALPLIAALTACGGSGAEDGHLVQTHDPDTLAWVSEGQPIRFEGRDYYALQHLVYDPLITEAGEAEGVRFYAPADARRPYPRLFLHVGSNSWLPFEPSGAEPAPRALADTLLGRATPQLPDAAREVGIGEPAVGDAAAGATGEAAPQAAPADTAPAEAREAPPPRRRQPRLLGRPVN